MLGTRLINKNRANEEAEHQFMETKRVADASPKNIKNKYLTQEEKTRVLKAHYVQYYPMYR